jgi:hypothetical protein
LQEYQADHGEGASRSWTEQPTSAPGIPVSRLKFESVRRAELQTSSTRIGASWTSDFRDLNPIASPTVNAAGQMVYNLTNITRATYVKYDRDDLRSRWQGQIGLRVRF